MKQSAFQKMCTEAFTLSLEAKKLSDLARLKKQEIIKHIKKTRLWHGRPLKVWEGEVLLSTRETLELDIEQIAGLIESGKVSLLDVLQTANFNVSKLRGLLKKDFSESIVERKMTEYITLRPSKDFKTKYEVNDDA